MREGKTSHWQGDRRQTTVWEIANNNPFGNPQHEQSWGHGTQKPVECMRRPIANNSRPGQAVYDPFLGSGTSVIAAEMTGRVCFGIELSPHYVDVVVRRWSSADWMYRAMALHNIAAHTMAAENHVIICGYGRSGQNLARLLEQESRANREIVSSLVESIAGLQGDTGDRRLHLLGTQLKKLQARLDLLAEMARRDFLAKIEHEAEELAAGMADSRTAAIMTALIEIQVPSLNLFCESLLDRLIEATGAERGFVLFYLPESTEADVVAARNFQTKNLSLEEYDFSRTLLREVLKRGTPLLLEDVSNDPAYSTEVSVVKFQLKSVLAGPLKQDQRTVGAIYLENNTRPCAFDEEDPTRRSTRRIAGEIGHRGGDVRR